MARNEEIIFEDCGAFVLFLVGTRWCDAMAVGIKGKWFREIPEPSKDKPGGSLPRLVPFGSLFPQRLITVLSVHFIVQLSDKSCFAIP